MPLETLLVVCAIASVFLIFMAVVMWCDARSGSEQPASAHPLAGLGKNEAAHGGRETRVGG
jgi:hypothetical protein